MEVKKIGQSVIEGQLSKNSRYRTGNLGVMYNVADTVSFQGSPSKLGNKMWFHIRNLSKIMSDVGEITNAVIAAIGTGIIAPLIILASPGKGDKEDKDKKAFQALRQPLSAGLQLAFQLPATFAVTNAINKLAYEKNSTLFDDKVLGHLIPDTKYLKGKVTKKELREFADEFETNAKGMNLKGELETKIRNDYYEFHFKLTPEKLAKEVKKRKKSFLLDKIADKKHSEFLEKKIEELRQKKISIAPLDLVNESYQDLAIQRNKEIYNNFRKDAKLSVWDKVIDSLGFSNAKLSKLKEKQKNFAKAKGLELLKEDYKDILTDENAKLRRYVEVAEEKSKEMFKHRKFLISLCFNLVMLAASCCALNWIHPRFKDFMDKIKHKNTDNTQDKKVEVKA